MQTLQQLISGQLAGSTRLKLSAGLTQFPKEIFNLADTLEILDLSGNHLSALPDDFGKLKNLKIVFFSNNYFTEFPKVLSQCAQLDMIGFKANKIATIAENAIPENTRWLILTDNCLTSVPASIGKCSRLQKLMLAGNRLNELPNELSLCSNLSLLRISMNNIRELPSWLFNMPRLYWLAFSANPCQSSPVIINSFTTIPWQQLTLTQQLGEGASGIISKAVWVNNIINNAPEEVAVKVFKGDVTSDGMPADEMNACALAGRHANLPPVLGKIAGHPAGKQGLVLKLIPPSFINLGGPPGFETCTRDTFPPKTNFSIHTIITILEGIAAVVAHLHAQGIMHGDLYAHNILINTEGQPLLTDFGAATAYFRTDKILAFALERLETGAFGCLTDDLLQHADTEAAGHALFNKLGKLRDDCLHANAAQRPDFMDITGRITQIKMAL